MEQDFSYSVAIRTLGKAGEKYQQELDSLVNQTIPPKKILVYLAEGYERPKETVGIEEIIYCPKGMVSQRARDYKEVDTSYVLMLDDDVYLPPTAVETMFQSLIEMQGDCIAADTFPNQELSLLNKIKAILSNWVMPIYSKKWGIMINKAGTFLYNNHPTKNVYEAQDAAGPCSLWILDSFRSIHYTDELWMDKMGFAYCDELLYFHKLYRNKGKLLIHYTCGVKHLDAQSARRDYTKDHLRLFNRSKISFVLWWRTQYEADDLRFTEKYFAIIVYSLKILSDVIVHLLLGLSLMSRKPLTQYIKGIISGYKYVKSEEYQQVPNYIVK